MATIKSEIYFWLWF